MPKRLQMRPNQMISMQIKDALYRNQWEFGRAKKQAAIERIAINDDAMPPAGGILSRVGQSPIRQDPLNIYNTQQ